jgi:CelD/BcsL family acetyltransferase involved in cellulose biosynthesis
VTNLFEANLSRYLPRQSWYAQGAVTNRIGSPEPKVCDIEIVTARARFDALEQDWNALFDRAARPDQLFQNFNWLWHWANHFLNARTRLRVIAGWRDGRLAMVWPLVETRTFGLRKLVWMGEPVSQYGDALVEPGALAHRMLAEGWNEICALGADFALLRKTREASSAGLVIADTMPCLTNAAPVLDFGKAARFDDVLARLPGKVRSSRRRLSRRLMEQGDISLKASSQNEDRAFLIRCAFDLKRTWLLRRGRYSAAIEDDATLNFFIDAASSKERPVDMPIDTIYRGPQPIGIGISLSCKGESFGHIIAHDCDFEKQGVGVVLSEHILRSCFERGCARFDMLAPRDAYKMEWTEEALPVHDWIKPFTPAGRLYAKCYTSALLRIAVDRLKNLPPSAGGVLWPALRRFKKIAVLHR